MAIRMQQGSMPHIYWIDLKNDGVYTECAVMRKDGLGNVYFFALNTLDNIDKKRLARILTNRNATHFELWDLMSNMTLNNGVNALTYFHQLVSVMTPGGQVMKPREGTIGVDPGVIDTRTKDARRSIEDNKIMADTVAKAAAEAVSNAVRNSQTTTAPTPATTQQLNEDEIPKKRTTRRKTTTDEE